MAKLREAIDFCLTEFPLVPLGVPAATISTVPEPAHAWLGPPFRCMDRRALERSRFQKVRRGGGHVTLKPRVPRVRRAHMPAEMKIGTLAASLRQADLSPDEFMIDLNK